MHIAHILIVCGAGTRTAVFVPARTPPPAHFSKKMKKKSLLKMDGFFQKNQTVYNQEQLQIKSAYGMCMFIFFCSNLPGSSAQIKLL